MTQKLDEKELMSFQEMLEDVLGELKGKFKVL
jgi:hypothetical protein